jgi:hypothetical protein
VTSLERELRSVGVEWPPTPDLAGSLEPRLWAQPGARRTWLRPLAVALAALVVAAGAVLVASPGARSAVLRFFHIRGATVTRVDELPPLRAGTGLGLGRPVPLAEARAAVSFPLRLPEGSPPATVLLDRGIGHGAVSLVWCCPRLVLTELRGEALPFVEKLAGPGTRIEPLSVGGSPGVWVAGHDHAVIFRDEQGRIVELPRLARNVLLWEAGGVTFRLEGNVTRERALAIAASLD